MKRTHRNIAIITTALLGINTPMAMENPEVNYFQGVAKATETLATFVFNVTPDKNTISCALGPVQIFETMHQALTNSNNENTIKEEIETLLGHNVTTDGLKQFNSLVAAEFINKTFMNNFYILPAKKGVNKDVVKSLSELGSTVVPLDFSKAKNAAKEINKIIATDTQEMIKDLAQPEQFSSDTKVVFLSTLYVNAKWNATFNKTSLSFHTQNETKFVGGFKGLGSIYYSESDKHQILTIPAANKTYLMIKLSKQSDSVSPVPPITTAEWNKDSEAAKSVQTELTMPNFTIENTLDLKHYFMKSVPTLLNSKSYFQTTLTNDPLQVTVFLQKNKIVVNKDGLEAASATMMSMSRCMPEEPKQKIVVDRPFSYLLYKGIGNNKQNNGSKDFLFLFSGTVVDPTQKS